MRSYSDCDLNIVFDLSQLKKGICVMQKIEGDEFVFRYGLIGANDGGNNALSRLLQIDGGQHQWRYVRLVGFDNTYDTDLLNQHKQKLEIFFQSISIFNFIPNNQRFKVEVDNIDHATAGALVGSIFDKFFRSVKDGWEISDKPV